MGEKEIEAVKEIDEVREVDETQALNKEAALAESLRRVNPRFLTESQKIDGLLSHDINPYQPHVLMNFNGIGKYKSIWRAMRKGKASVDGTPFPKKPFNNRKNKPNQDIKKAIHNELKKYRNRVNRVESTSEQPIGE